MSRWQTRIAPWLQRNRTWLSRAVLMVGVALVAAQLLPGLIASRQVVMFDFGHDRRRVKQLTFTWTREGGDPIQGGATLTPPLHHLEPLSHSFRVPDGLYRFELTVERTDAQGRSTNVDYVRRVALEGHPTTLLLHDRH